MDTASELSAASADTVRAMVNQLIAGAETLAAVGLALAHRGGDVALPPEYAAGVDAVAASVLGNLDAVPPPALATLGSFARALLAQSAAFSAQPTEPGAWAVSDPHVLRTLGQGSAGLAGPIAALIEAEMPALAHRLATSEVAVLDVGTGVAALACAFARQWSSARVVGLDVWDPALQIAAGVIASDGLGGRVSVRLQDVAMLDEPGAYDLIWFAAPFIPQAVISVAMPRIRAALRDGGALVFGTFDGPDPRSKALADLRTVRSGGPVLSDVEAVRLITEHGFSTVSVHRSNIGAPVRLVLAA